ncbi:mitotic checkpoint protein [Moniliophthora roreri MCA 2997]|uniref:Mitotic checkpoint protein n=2 Tax=Moniliophthora roreri TaxID=221103 RepID=V2X3E5_MONRO|nr:mitotic checkpoint protein [Moniliophthora roreri MCA 2997]KAI3606332.1 mitotic checkpoint protein [Moniliophthora roreri]
MADPSQFALPSAPFDSISQVKFSPTNSDHLLTSSWDTTVRLYEARDETNSQQKCKFDHRAAVIACCFEDEGHGFSGGLDTAVRHLDFENEKVNVLGSHSDSVSAIVYTSERNALITGSWDRTLRFFDPRAATAQVSSHETPERVYKMDIVNNTLVVAMASRLFNIYDVRKMDMPAQQRESSLKYMTRSIACMVTGEGYATASVEGRIAVEYFDPSEEAQQKKYAFKCHRLTEDGVDHVWPVNSLAFHPVYNTFASAGSDGTVSVWDHKIKKRLRQYPKYDNPVSSVAFNKDGTKMAVATCYTWDEGEAGSRWTKDEKGQQKERERPMIRVRKIGSEVKPKGWDE